MLGEKHDLIHELPEFRHQIHQLKLTDQHFVGLLERYEDLDDQVRRIEEGFINTSDEYIEGLKKERLLLKDELFTILKHN